jgi:hypothetical protein
VKRKAETKAEEAAKHLKARNEEDKLATANKKAQDNFENGQLQDFKFSEFPFGQKGRPLSTQELVAVFDKTTFQRLGHRLLPRLYKGTQPVITISVDLPLWCWRTGVCVKIPDIMDGTITTKGGTGARGNTLIYLLRPKSSSQLSDFDFLFDTGFKDATTWRTGRKCWVCNHTPCPHTCKISKILKLTYDTREQLLEVTLQLDDGCV